MQKDFEAFIGQGEQAQRRSWRLAKGDDLGVMQKEKKKGKKENVCEEGVFSSYVWRGAHGRLCVGIKHERNLCKKCLWQSLWTFGSISFFSQIHRWIYVKIESVLVWKVEKALPKFQHDRAFCKGAMLVGSRGG